MKTQELIKIFKANLPEDMMLDENWHNEIIQHLLELDELREKIKELKLFLDDVSKYVA